ncbi:MAG: hypothetical protein WCD20_00360 [Rhodomicrobium sp.]
MPEPETPAYERGLLAAGVTEMRSRVLGGATIAQHRDGETAAICELTGVKKDL